MHWGRLLTVYGVVRVSQCRGSTVTASQPAFHNAIPGPSCYPIVGTLPDMLTDKDFDQEQSHLYFMKLFRKYGPIVKIKYPAQPPMILLIKPADCQELLQRTMQDPVRPPIASIKQARYSNPYYNKKGGLTAENGEEWWRVRSKVQVPLMKQKYLRYYLEDMDRVALDFLDRIATLRDSNGLITVDFKEELEKWSLENICLIALNQRVGCFDPNVTQGSESDLLIRSARDFMNAVKECETGSKLWKLYPTKIYKQLQRSMDKLIEVCQEVAQKAEHEMQARKLRKEPLSHQMNMLEHLLMEPGLTRTDITTLMMDLIPGGTETTSDNAGVLLYLLAKHPAVQKKVQEEVDQVLGDGKAPITPQQLARLTYTRAAFKEANRLMPPMLGPVRNLQEDLHLGGYTLKKGWLVLPMSALSAWDKEQFSRPLEFLPERWLRHRPLGPIHPHASLPFSFGIRACVGRRIAEQEIFILIARTLHRFNLDWKHGELERTFRFVFSPKGPLKLTFVDR